MFYLKISNKKQKTFMIIKSGSNQPNISGYYGLNYSATIMKYYDDKFVSDHYNINSIIHNHIINCHHLPRLTNWHFVFAK